MRCVPSCPFLLDVAATLEPEDMHTYKLISWGPATQCSFCICLQVKLDCVMSRQQELEGELTSLSNQQSTRSSARRRKVHHIKESIRGQENLVKEQTLIKQMYPGTGG